ncbi:MAG: tetratricopeptide repeat protein [Alphaproteobacteria bacterium]|nr:tetratricopeptide repeat protein [Alphaproteobacteria bacterium]
MMANPTFVILLILAAGVLVMLLLYPLWVHYRQSQTNPTPNLRSIMPQFALNLGRNFGATAEAIDLSEGETRFKVARQQLTELERDLDYALVEFDAAESSRQEIEHRLLRYADLAESVSSTASDSTASDNRAPLRLSQTMSGISEDEDEDEDEDGTVEFLHSAPSNLAARAGLLCLAAFMICGALGTYLWLGAPDLRDLPLHKRGAEWTARQELRAMVTSLERHLQEHPNDGDSFALLGQFRLNLGQLAASIAAFDRALILAPERIDVAEKLGEVLVAEASGIVTPRATDLFRAVLNKDPDAAISRYYFGLAHEQAGEKQAAFDIYLQLGQESPKTAPWLPELQAHLDNLGRVLNRPVPQFLDPLALANAALPEAGGKAQMSDRSALPVLSEDDVTKMSGLSPEQRQAKILTMVDQLALRLRDNPADAEGWFRLSKARAILGQTELSHDALSEAARRGPDRIDIQLAYAHMIYPPELSQSPPSDEFITVMRRILSLDPLQPEALWFVGRSEITTGNKELGRSLLTRLLNRLPPNSPIRGDVERALAGNKPN